MATPFNKVLTTNGAGKQQGGEWRLKTLKTMAP